MPASSPGLANSSAQKRGKGDADLMRLKSRSNSGSRDRQSCGPRQPRRQIARKRQLQARIGAQGDVVDVDHPAAPPQLLQKGAKLGLVRTTQRMRLGEHLA